MQGFHGQVLRVQLPDCTVEVRPVPEEILQRIVGGVGLGSWLMLQEQAGEYAAFAPEAPLVFAFGPLAGTALNTSAKAAVLCKSPLTQRLNDAMISSRFALSGKRLGGDALILTGTCADWSVLVLGPDGARLQSAAPLMGKSAAETEIALQAELGEDWSIATIGPAGEELIPFAVLSHDGRHAGRGGIGAVLGSKKIKAIAVRGDRATSIAHPEKFAEIQNRLRQRSQGSATEKYRTTGTLGNLLVFNRLSILPTRNFRGTSDENAPALSAERMFSEMTVERTTCADCMIGCEKRVRTKNGGSVRLEYENFFALGALTGVWDADIVLEASSLCDELGLDTITFGGTLAFLLECVERGLAEVPELQNFQPADILEAIHKTVRREGYGEMLALGSRQLADLIGGGSLAFAPQVKGLELPGYHPAHLQTLALGLAVGSRGADHNKSGGYDLDLSGKVDRNRLDNGRIAEMVAIEDQAALIDSLILCKFIRLTLEDFYGESAEILTALTGREFRPEQLRENAGMIHHLKKLFNQRQGWQAEEDSLPERFFTGNNLAAGNGDAAGEPETINRAEFLSARETYYKRRGWDSSGRLAVQEPWLSE